MRSTFALPVFACAVGCETAALPPGAGDLCDRACDCRGSADLACPQECADAVAGEAVAGDCVQCARAAACGAIAAACAEVCGGAIDAFDAPTIGGGDGDGDGDGEGEGEGEGGGGEGEAEGEGGREAEAEAEAESEAESEGEPRACEGTTEGDRGVGRPCRTARDCAGLEASRCPVQDDPSAPAFCTLPCGFGRECGDGLICCFRIELCVPESCFAPLCEDGGGYEGEGEGGYEGEGEEVRCEDRPTDAVNDLGLGEPCREQEDCAGLEMNLCGAAQFAGAPAFCTRHCDCNRECGEAGICTRAAFGRGRCVPVRCDPENPGLPCR